MIAVKSCGDALAYANEELKADKEVVLAALNSENKRFNSKVLEAVCDDLRSDKEVVLAGVKAHGVLLSMMSDEFGRVDKEVVISAVASTPYALRFASEELQNDPSYKS
ncbi:hypothetical protein OURE66S_04210 [Oligella ureolytica]